MMDTHTHTHTHGVGKSERIIIALFSMEKVKTKLIVLINSERLSKLRWNHTKDHHTTLQRMKQIGSNRSSVTGTALLPHLLSLIFYPHHYPENAFARVTINLDDVKSKATFLTSLEPSNRITLRSWNTPLNFHDTTFSWVSSYFIRFPNFLCKLCLLFLTSKCWCSSKA